MTNPYPHTKPRLREFWQRGFDSGTKITIIGRGTPCQMAFNGGAQRRIDMEAS